MREYTLHQKNADAKKISAPENKTVKDKTVENSHTVISEAKQRNRIRYDAINKDRKKTEDIFDFVPITSKTKKDKQNAILANLPLKSQTKKQSNNKPQTVGHNRNCTVHVYRSNRCLFGYLKMIKEKTQ